MKKWYIAQTFSKFENKVVSDLTSRRNSMNLQDKIFRILAPEEEYVEIKHDKRKKEDVEVIKKRKIYPGYIFIEIEVEKEIDDETWYIIRNTPGVTGLLGSSGNGTKPIPVSTKQINSILAKEGLLVVDENEVFAGDTVQIIGGWLAGRVGTATQVVKDKDLVKVVIESENGLSLVTECSYREVKKIK